MLESPPLDMEKAIHELGGFMEFSRPFGKDLGSVKQTFSLLFSRWISDLHHLTPVLHNQKSSVDQQTIPKNRQSQLLVSSNLAISWSILANLPLHHFINVIFHSGRLSLMFGHKKYSKEFVTSGQNPKEYYKELLNSKTKLPANISSRTKR